MLSSALLSPKERLDLLQDIQLAALSCGENSIIVQAAGAMGILRRAHSSSCVQRLKTRKLRSLNFPNGLLFTEEDLSNQKLTVATLTAPGKHWHNQNLHFIGNFRRSQSMEGLSK